MLQIDLEMKKRITGSVLRWGIPLVLILIILLFRWFPAWAEGYSRYVYPLIANVLSAFSSMFPFSIGDCFIVMACLWVVVYPFYAWYKRKKPGCVTGKIIRFLFWIYIWFYLAWGINYFRIPFYERAGFEKAGYSTVAFQDFLEEYACELNRSFEYSGDTLTGWYIKPYKLSGRMDSLSVVADITEGYRKIASRFGLAEPGKHLKVKNMLWSKGMSKVGVSGYMGPFFSEFNVNAELLNVEYPFTYAHELAHRLGIAGEAEANLYAYLVTVSSSQPGIRFSGYFSMLGYVLSNAYRLLPAEEYRLYLQKFRPEIIGLYKEHLNYWRFKYNPQAGKIQGKVYNAYLKGNKISDGTKNYSEVISLLMSLRAAVSVQEIYLK